MSPYALHAPVAHVPWPRGYGRVEAPQQEIAPRQSVTYVCAKGCEFGVPFAADVEAPPAWDCRCGAPARLAGTPEGTEGSLPLPGYTTPGSGSYKRSRDEITPRAQLAKRRSKAEGEELLAERLAELRQQRGVAL